MTVKEFSDICKDNNITFGAAESFTGGQVAAQITDIPGASKFFKGSLITYFTEEKERILGIPRDVIEEHGVVSLEVAGEMAYRAKMLLDTDLALSFTGNAGPSSMENKPVGLIYIGVAFEQVLRVYEYKLEGSRQEIQNKAIELAFDCAYENYLKKFKK